MASSRAGLIGLALGWAVDSGVIREEVDAFVDDDLGEIMSNEEAEDAFETLRTRRPIS
jgi:hypothetical protein